MGFGHRVYRTGDSRVPAMRELARRLSERTGERFWLPVCETLEETMAREKNLCANVDLYAAVVLRLMGFPSALNPAIFALSRVAGWCAHVIEQHDHNHLIRPRSIYTGPPRAEAQGLDPPCLSRHTFTLARSRVRRFRRFSACMKTIRGTFSLFMAGLLETMPRSGSSIISRQIIFSYTRRWFAGLYNRSGVLIGVAVVVSDLVALPEFGTSRFSSLPRSFRTEPARRPKSSPRWKRGPASPARRGCGSVSSGATRGRNDSGRNTASRKFASSNRSEPWVRVYRGCAFW